MLRDMPTHLTSGDCLVLAAIYFLAGLVANLVTPKLRDVWGRMRRRR